MMPLIAERGTGEPLSLHGALLAGKKVPPDATGLLMEDHRVVLGWFDWYAAATDEVTKAEVARRICMALWAHMAAEEEIFYPTVRDNLGLKDLVQEAVQEHEGAKALMRRIETGELDSAGRDRSVEQLAQEIQAHVAAEEGELFPQVRESQLDLYELGRAMAARRVDRLFEQRRAGSAESGPREYPAMPVSQSEAQHYFVLGLKNAHATAQQCRTMVAAQAKRVEQYPVVAVKLDAHLKEKDAQLERLEQILERAGESPSAFKEAAMTLWAGVSSMAASMAGDEIIKNGLADLAMAKFEAAAYETLILFGQACGATEALPLLQQSLSEERAMAAFLEENLRPTAIRFLQLKSEGAQASH